MSFYQTKKNECNLLYNKQLIFGLKGYFFKKKWLGRQLKELFGILGNTLRRR